MTVSLGPKMEPTIMNLLALKVAVPSSVSTEQLLVAPVRTLQEVE